MRVLWVENHETFAKLAARQFLHDVELTIVSSVQAALAVRLDEFDAVLVDYDLDDGKGDEVVRLLTKLARRPMIVATSSHEDGNRALLAAGADASCSKMRFSTIRAVLNLDGGDR